MGITAISSHIKKKAMPITLPREIEEIILSKISIFASLLVDKYHHKTSSAKIANAVSKIQRFYRYRRVNSHCPHLTHKMYRRAYIACYTDQQKVTFNFPHSWCYRLGLENDPDAQRFLDSEEYPVSRKRMMIDFIDRYITTEEVVSELGW